MMNIEGKKISIIGAVRSGVGAAKLAKRKGAIPFVSDSGDEQKLNKEMQMLNEQNIKCEIGTHSPQVFEADLIVTSPGVPSGSEVLRTAINKSIPVVSELEFASWFCNGTIIAITGTNGKTTTTYLCGHTLNTAGLTCHVAGNIGFAFSEICDSVKPTEYVALETSSFQLDHISKFKPKIAVILNITPDHLDRYENKFENYKASKIKIGANQNENDFMIYNFDDKEITFDNSLKSKRIGFSIDNENSTAFIRNGEMILKLDREEIICNRSDLKIKGNHNAANGLAVLAAAKIIGCENNKIKKAFETFEGVEHRLEFVRELNGVIFINDSKATNVDSVWYALQSFDQPIILILGGKDKGNNYNQIKELVKQKVKMIYAIGSSADKVYDFFKDFTVVKKLKNFQEVTMNSITDSLRGDVVLLSPACASFDMFDNYEHRGKEFKNAVNNL